MFTKYTSLSLLEYSLGTLKTKSKNIKTEHQDAELKCFVAGITK